MPNCKSGSSQSQNKNNYVPYKVLVPSHFACEGHRPCDAKKTSSPKTGLENSLLSPLPPGFPIFTNHIFFTSGFYGPTSPPLDFEYFARTCTLYLVPCTLYVVCLNPGFYARHPESRVFTAGAIDVVHHVLSDDGECHEHESVGSYSFFVPDPAENKTSQGCTATRTCMHTGTRNILSLPAPHPCIFLRLCLVLSVSIPSTHHCMEVKNTKCCAVLAVRCGTFSCLISCLYVVPCATTTRTIFKFHNQQQIWNYWIQWSWQWRHKHQLQCQWQKWDGRRHPLHLKPWWCMASTKSNIGWPLDDHWMTIGWPLDDHHTLYNGCTSHWIIHQKQMHQVDAVMIATKWLRITRRTSKQSPTWTSHCKAFKLCRRQCHQPRFWITGIFWTTL